MSRLRIDSIAEIFASSVIKLPLVIDISVLQSLLLAVIGWLDRRQREAMAYLARKWTYTNRRTSRQRVLAEIRQLVVRMAEDWYADACYWRSVCGSTNLLRQIRSVFSSECIGTIFASVRRVNTFSIVQSMGAVRFGSKVQS